MRRFSTSSDLEKDLNMSWYGSSLLKQIESSLNAKLSRKGDLISSCSRATSCVQRWNRCAKRDRIDSRCILVQSHDSSNRANAETSQGFVPPTQQL
mmetsp:Transcript_14047/g.20995  ORF Transcript_14047/g.20995 Transcript_14047/m.20995 type:complete len:96 (+) Transcript_14047:298-585(+)